MLKVEAKSSNSGPISEPKVPPRQRKTLTVDGVLTIAEDVMSNQGRKFIEMMERLADLRFRKEQDAKREVQDAGGPYEDEYDDDDEENGYYEGEDGEDSEEEEVKSK